MPKKTLESLGTLVKKKRADLKLRETAKTIGIGSATLMRVEGGHIPDVSTFGRICKWLEVDPGEFLGFEQDSAKNSNSEFAMLSGHFRTDKTPQADTVQALARMIDLALKMQPQATINNG